MGPITVTPVKLFVASGAETKPIRDEIVIALKALSEVHRATGFIFEAVWWEDQSEGVPLSGVSQDVYNKRIEDCDMVAVVIQNRLGAYTEREFNHAVAYFKSKGLSQRVIVYTLPTNENNEARFNFVKGLRSGAAGSETPDYFHSPAGNPDQLILRITRELLRIKCEYEAELKAAVESATDTVSRIERDSSLTKEAVGLFEQGDYAAASRALDMDKIREQAKRLADEQKEAAKAFVLKAKLELTDVRNKDRFTSAERLFDEALAASREPGILFEAAYYCQGQNNFDKAEKLYVEALAIFRELAAASPAVYTPDVAMTLNNLAILHSDTNRYEQAETEYNEALELYRELATANPAAYNPDVAMTLNNLANMHSVTNEYEQAEAEFIEALELYRELAAANPAAYTPKVATTLNNLAVLHSDINEHEQAEAEYKEALGIRRELAAANPAAYNPDVAMTLNNLAILHRNINEHEQAEAEYKEALDLYRELAATNPAMYNSVLARTLNNFGLLYIKTNRKKHGHAMLEEALELLMPFHQAYPKAYQDLCDKIKRNLTKAEQ